MAQIEVVKRFGEPSRKVGTADVDIWAYDLRRFGDTHYSIRIAFSDVRVSQTYLGLELV